MSFWWVDRVLPGVVATAICAPVAFLIQHRALSSKFHDITRKQTAELKKHLRGERGGANDPGDV